MLIGPHVLVFALFAGACVLRMVNELGSLETLHSPELRQRARNAVVVAASALILALLANGLEPAIMAPALVAAAAASLLALQVDRDLLRRRRDAAGGEHEPAAVRHEAPALVAAPELPVAVPSGD